MGAHLHTYRDMTGRVRKPPARLVESDVAPVKKRPKSSKPKASKSIKKTKSGKDPNKPKKNLSAFMFFSKDMREEVVADNPDASFGEIGKLLGAAWKDLSAKDKKPYEAKAEKDKKRY